MYWNNLHTLAQQYCCTSRSNFLQIRIKTSSGRSRMEAIWILLCTFRIYWSALADKISSNSVQFMVFMAECFKIKSVLCVISYCLSALTRLLHSIGNRVFACQSWIFFISLKHRSIIFINLFPGRVNRSPIKHHNFIRFHISNFHYSLYWELIKVQQNAAYTLCFVSRTKSSCTYRILLKQTFLAFASYCSLLAHTKTHSALFDDSPAASISNIH